MSTPATMKAWTPGPWKAMEHPGSSRHSSRTFCIHNEGNGSGETVIATASANDCWGVPLEANARLIAKAPDMADVLRELSDAKTNSQLHAGLLKARLMLAEIEGAQ